MNPLIERLMFIDACLVFFCLGGMLVLGCFRAQKHITYWKENLDDLRI